MLAKITVSAILVTGALCASAFGQQPLYQPRVAAPVVPASFSFQDQANGDATNNAQLQEALERLQLRLRELEDDVERNLGSQPAQARRAAEQNEEIGERLVELEECCDDQGKTIDRLEGALPGFVVHGHKTPSMKFFGRIHQDYWAFPEIDETLYPLEATAGNPSGNPQDRFNFRRLRIGVSGDLNDNMFYKYEGEFAGGNGNTSYRDAFFGFKHLPRLNTVIIGNHKRPYGLDHLNSSKNNVFIERPLMVEAFNQDNRRLGISSNGFTEDLGWNWRYGVWNQKLTQGLGGYVGDHYQLEFAARLARTAWYDESSGGRGYAHFALSGSVGNPDDSARYRTRPEARNDNRWYDTGVISAANENYLIGVESVLNIGPLNLTSEYMRVNVDREDVVAEDVAFDGYYTQVSYLLTGEHHPWNREMGTLGRLKPFENFFSIRDCDGNKQKGIGAWEVAVRYSHADLNDFDILGGEGDAFTFGLNWYWNPYARMQANYIVGEIESGPDNAGQGEYQMVGIRMMVDF